MSKHKKKRTRRDEANETKSSLRPTPTGNLWPAPSVESTCRFSATQNKTPRRHVRYQEKLNKRDPPKEMKSNLCCYVSV